MQANKMQGKGKTGKKNCQTTEGTQIFMFIRVYRLRRRGTISVDVSQPTATASFNQKRQRIYESFQRKHSTL